MEMPVAKASWCRTSNVIHSSSGGGKNLWKFQLRLFVNLPKDSFRQCKVKGWRGAQPPQTQTLAVHQRSSCGGLCRGGMPSWK